MAEEVAYTRDELINDDVFRFLVEISDPHTRQAQEEKIRGFAEAAGCLDEWNKKYADYKYSCVVSQLVDKSGETNFPDGRAPLKLPCQKWMTSLGGIFRPKYSREYKAFMDERICATPVLPTGILKNAETGMEKVQLSYYDHGRWHDVICEREKLSSNTQIVKLSNVGISVIQKNAEALSEFLGDCMDENRDAIPRYVSLSRMGWYENGFVPYTSDVVFDSEQEYKTIYDAVCTKGSFEEWKEYVGKLRKNTLLRIVMGAAFASPLLSKMGALPFILHLWGGTGAGKSVSLMVSMSIWGNPAMGKMTRSLNATPNAAMATATALCDLPFAGDEFQTIKAKPSQIDDLIMNLCEGSNRSRMKGDKMCETKSWNCCCLFTGEEPITRDTSGGGAKNRVIEIECTSKLIENGNETANFVRDNYGHAGRTYIEFVCEHLDELKELYKKYASALCYGNTTDKQALSMAAVMLGDAAGRMALFPDEEPLEAADVMPFLKSKDEVDTSERAYAIMNDIFVENSYRFEREYPVNSAESQSPPDLPKGDGYSGTWGWFEDGGRIAIIKSVLVHELDKHGFSFEAIKAKWTEKGYLIKNKQGKMMHQTKRKGIAINYILLQLYTVKEEQHT